MQSLGSTRLSPHTTIDLDSRMRTSSKDILSKESSRLLLNTASSLRTMRLQDIHEKPSMKALVALQNSVVTAVGSHLARLLCLS